MDALQAAEIIALLKVLADCQFVLFGLICGLVFAVTWRA